MIRISLTGALRTNSSPASKKVGMIRITGRQCIPNANDQAENIFGASRRKQAATCRTIPHGEDPVVSQRPETASDGLCPSSFLRSWMLSRLPPFPPLPDLCYTLDVTTARMFTNGKNLTALIILRFQCGKGMAQAHAHTMGCHAAWSSTSARALHWKTHRSFPRWFCERDEPFCRD